MSDAARLVEAGQGRRLWFEWAFFFVAAVILGAYVASTLWGEYRRIAAEEQARLMSEATVVDQNLGRQLLTIDRILAAIRSDLGVILGQANGPALLERRLKSVCESIPGLRTLVVMDGQGLAIASNRAELRGLDFRDGERFQQAMRGGDPDQLYVSEPYVTPLGTYGIALTKVLPDERRQSGGVVLAVVDPDYFGTLLASVRYAPDVLTSIIHGHGQIVFRVPDPQGLAGLNLAAKPGAFVVDHLARGRQVSTYEGVVASSGEDRMVVLRSIWPGGVHLSTTLVVALSRERQALFGHWRIEAGTQAFLFVALVSTAALALISMQQRRHTVERMTAGHLVELESEREKAVRANHAKSRLLATLSHDLRQPLQALGFYHEVLARRAAPEDRPVLDNMENCIGSVHRLTGALLDLSRLESGAVPVQVADFALHRLLAKVASGVAPEAAGKGLRLRIVPTATVVRTDPVLLEQIVVNLAVNAIRYTERGGVLIGCRRRQGRLWITVCDTGIGIAEDKLDEIFEEFRRLHQSDPERADGVGLGLAIVRKTAALLGLELLVRSRPGRGSVFALEVPPAAGS